MPCVCDDSSTEASVGGGGSWWGGGWLGGDTVAAVESKHLQQTGNHMRQSEMELFLNTSPNHGNAAANPA